MSEDIYDNALVCNHCNQETNKTTINKDGFLIRAWVCPSCNASWEHPGDVAEQESFQKLQQKNFKVKLRFVGNSYAVSIPREIINFLEEFNQIEDQFIQLSLERPEKITLIFKEESRKFY